MSWISLLIAPFAVKKPAIGLMVYQIYENLLQVASGGTGAPKVSGRALDVFAGEITISGTTADGITDLDGRTWLRADLVVNNTSGGLVNVQMRFSNDNGSSYGSWQTMVAISSGTDIIGTLRLNLDTGEYALKRTTLSVIQRTSGTFTVPADANAFEMRSDTASGVNGSVDVYSFGGVA